MVTIVEYNVKVEVQGKVSDFFVVRGVSLTIFLFKFGNLKILYMCKIKKNTDLQCICQYK